MSAATEAKTAIENAQREAAQLRDHQGVAWRPNFFVEHNDRFIPMLKCVRFSRRNEGTD